MHNISQNTKSPTCLTGTPYEHLYPFARDVLGYDRLAPQPHHELCEFLEEAVAPLFSAHRHPRQRRSLLAAPRGTFKTTLLCALAIWLIVQYPNIRILLDTFATKFSRQLLYDIKWQLTWNEVFTNLFGNLGKDTTKWSEDSIIINTRNRALKEGTIDVGGVDSPRTGGHYDVELVDDLINEKTALTRGGLVKSKRHVGTLTPILEPGGCQIFTFTRWAFNDCYGKMLDDEEKLAKGQKTSVTPEGPIYRKLIRGAYLPDGRLFAPTILPESTLEQLRRELTDKEYSVWYMNSPIEESSKVFPRSIIRFYKGQYTFDAMPFITVEVS